MVIIVAIKWIYWEEKESLDREASLYTNATPNHLVISGAFKAIYSWQNSVSVLLYSRKLFSLLLSFRRVYAVRGHLKDSIFNIG